MKYDIFSLEDDPVTQQLIRISLPNYNILFCETIEDAQSKILTHTFKAILIDINLPDGDGIEFYSKIFGRENVKNTPVIFLTTNEDLKLKLIAFNLGADDYLLKPIDPLELMARVSGKIKKSTQLEESKNYKMVGNILIDLGRQQAFLMEQQEELSLDLTSYELKILNLLSRFVGMVYTRDKILDEVWSNISITDRTVDSHIAHLRKKIVNTNVKIETVKNCGYKISYT